MPSFLPASSLGLLAGAVLSATTALADPDPKDWPAVLEEAEGQTVYWYAWGGDSRTNAYIAWAGDRVEQDFGVTVEHVKLEDTGTAVAQVLAERAAGKDQGGSVDLIWINGENFSSMKSEGLLFGPWAEDLPGWALVDVAGKPAVQMDFGVATDGLEAPWSMAQLVFEYDTARLTDPPRSIPALGEWIKANPGRFAYPQPPDFLGTTFLKQALLELTEDPDALTRPIDGADFDAVTAPLWAWLEEVEPSLWRQGRAYPQAGPRLTQLLADGETDISFSFNPANASSAIANNELPESVRTYVLEGGTLGNASYVAIPYNASAKAGAMVLANFLLSPEAQAKKQDPQVLGVPTVLDLDALAPADRALFDALDLGIATLAPDALGTTLPEPHPSWVHPLDEEWTRRFGSGQ